MTDKNKLLVINPGSTTTKMAVYNIDNLEQLFEENIVHDEAAILSFQTIADQEDYRKEMILEFLAKAGCDMSEFVAIVGRGGMLYDLEGGGYQVDENLYGALRSPELPQHASSLGGILAYSIAREHEIPAFIYDSTMGAELTDIAKITGIAGLEKYGATHLLNSRAQAIKYAEVRGLDYKKLNFINCHMGGGITINAMTGGVAIDVESYDDGPMAPERSGGVPLLLFGKMVHDEDATFADTERKIAGGGGMYSYLGTKDCREVEKMIDEGNQEAAVVYEAMAYQVAKSIAALSCAFKGKTDVIILTGGVAHSKRLTEMIKSYCGHIAEICVMPGESELEALAGGAKRMLEGREEIKKYR